MTTPTEPARTTFADVLRSLVRQLAAATYVLITFFALSSFVDVDAWATVALQGTLGAFGGWLLARITAGPWWTWLFMGPFLALLDFVLNFAVMSTVAEPLPFSVLARTIGPGSLAMGLVTVLGAFAGRRGSRRPGTVAEENQAVAAAADAKAGTDDRAP